MVWTLVPSWFKASARAWMGRHRMRVLPSMMTLLFVRVASAVRKRVAVPAFSV